MIIKPIIPIWIMSVICIILLILKRKGVWPYIRQIIIVALLFVINLRIQVPDGTYETTVQTAKAYVVFAIDDTISMLAEDYEGNKPRLDGVSKDCGEIIDNLYGARFTVLTFSNTAEVASPSTTDGSYIKNVIESIYPPNTYIAKGTNINVAKNTILDYLQTLKKKGDGSVYLVFVSDGELNNNNKLESFKEIGDYVDGSVVLGYGTSSGGRMYYEEYGYDGEYIQDTSSYPSKDAISHIDEANLKAIASDIGGKYYNMNSSSAADVYKYISNGIAYEETETTVEGYTDIYFIFAIPLVIMLILEMLIYKKKG